MIIKTTSKGTLEVKNYEIERSWSTRWEDDVQSDIAQGMFAFFPSEIFQCILEKVEDDTAYARHSRVNHLWYQEVQIAWRLHCNKRGFLQEESFWMSNGRDWKWICQAKLFPISQANPADGSLRVGWSEQGTAPRIWRYEGDWKDETMDGVGFKHDFKTGGQYKGTWKSGKLEGFGIFVDKCGDRYEGTWKEGMKDGNGTYCWGEGRWKGHTYIGGWKKGKMHGLGKYSYPSGTYYMGEWADDMMHGKGIYYFANGDVYDGEWAEDKRYGFGVFKFARHACRYEGQFKKGVREGFGTLTWKNGDRYEGEWKVNSRVGEGKLYLADGQIHHQIWTETLGALYYNIEPPKFPQDGQGTSFIIHSGSSAYDDQDVPSSVHPKEEILTDERPTTPAPDLESSGAC